MKYIGMSESKQSIKLLNQFNVIWNNHDASLTNKTNKKNAINKTEKYDRIICGVFLSNSFWGKSSASVFLAVESLEFKKLFTHGFAHFLRDSIRVKENNVQMCFVCECLLSIGKIGNVFKVFSTT